MKKTSLAKRLFLLTAASTLIFATSALANQLKTPSMHQLFFQTFNQAMEEEHSEIPILYQNRIEQYISQGDDFDKSEQEKEAQNEIQHMLSKSFSKAALKTAENTPLGATLIHLATEIEQYVTLTYQKDLPTGKEKIAPFKVKQKEIKKTPYDKKFIAELKPKVHSDLNDSGMQLELTLLGTCLQTEYYPLSNGIELSLTSHELNTYLGSSIKISGYKSENDYRTELTIGFQF